MKLKKKQTPEIEIPTRVRTGGFHTDDKDTVVLADGKLYDLIPSKYTYKQLLNCDLAERPHCRFLNIIEKRTQKEQFLKNEEDQQFHELITKYKDPEQIEEAGYEGIAELEAKGIDPLEEVHRLVELRLKASDRSERSKLKRQLKHLDYKRLLRGERAKKKEDRKQKKMQRKQKKKLKKYSLKEFKKEIKPSKRRYQVGDKYRD